MSHQQPAPYYPPPPPPSHSHDQYVVAIIGVGVVALLVGAPFGYGLGSLARPLGSSPQPQQNFTFAHGTVNIGNLGTPFSVVFDNQYTGSLSSNVYSNGLFYQVYLPVDKAYQVTIRYSTSFGVNTCQGRPSPFTPIGSDYAQDFLC